MKHPMTQNLLQRGHTWYVRYVVPRAYREKLGKESIFRSLKTRDLDKARKRKHGVLANIVAEVERVMNNGEMSRAEMIDEALAFSEEIKVAPNAEQADLAVYVATDRADHFGQKVGYEAGQLYADIALRGSVPISKAGEQYLQSIEGKVSQGTIEGRRRSINTFTANMGDMPLAKISPRITASWLTDHLEPSGKAPKTLAKYIDNMNLLWKWGFRREWCGGTSPFTDLKSEFRASPKRKRAFENEELRDYLKYLKQLPAKKVVEYEVALLLAYSAARLGEICELRVRDVFQGGSEVHIKDGKTDAAGRVLFFFNPECIDILKRRTIGKLPDDQVFEELKPGGQDQKLNHALSKRMRISLANVIPHAKAEGLDLHSIRRWGATVFENTPEIDLILSQRMIGHKTGKLLGDVYSSGPEKERLREGFEVFSQAVKSRLIVDELFEI